MTWVSIAKWPYPQVRLGNGDNTSADNHDTKEQAISVIQRLELEGFGGNGMIFPIETYVFELSDT